MTGKFILSRDTPQEVLDWGSLRWMSHPPSTNAEQLTVIEVTLQPGKGHDFHKHPDQEEVIYVISGEVEQWLETEKQNLLSGDSLFIPANAVHASFNSGSTDAKVLAILGPCVGDEGYELVDVAGEDPWNTLRN
ncbi:MAG: cupin domain-containing protein [Gammaproteobacteria bacterium]|nr:cupin domain-containing protein [Gammaproteobacteria bacterium]